MNLFQTFGKIWKILPASGRRWLTRRFQAGFTASAACVITNDNGCVLLLNHVLRPRSGWGLPGGFLERGEQPETAVRREIREETGLELANLRLERIRTMQRHLEIVYSAAAVGEPSVQSREIIGLDWFGIDGLPEEMSIAQQTLIKSILRPELE